MAIFAAEFEDGRNEIAGAGFSYVFAGEDAASEERLCRGGIR